MTQSTPLKTAAPDIFDPFGEHPTAVPLPIEEAVKMFQQHWGPDLQEHREALRPFYTMDEGARAQRVELQKAWDHRTEAVEVLLFRSAREHRA